MNRQSEKAEIDDFIKRSNDVKRTGNFDGALSILDEGLEKYPKSDLLCTYKVLFYLLMGRLVFILTRKIGGFLFFLITKKC